MGNHLPTGLWAPWGSPHPPWSPQVWVSEDSPFLPLFPCVAWGAGASVVSLDSWTLSGSCHMGRPRGAGTEAVGFFPGSGLGFEALPPIQPRGKFGREATPGGFPHTPPPLPWTFILHKRLVPSDKLIHMAAWLCVLSCGPRGHLGSSRPGGAGLPGLPLKVGEAAAAPQQRWKAAHLASPAPSRSHSLLVSPASPGPDKGTKGDASLPTPRFGLQPLGVPTRGPLEAAWPPGEGCEHRA